MARKPVERASDDLAWLEGGLEADPTLTDKHGIALMIGVTVKDVDRYVRDGMPIHGERKRGAPLQFRVPDCVQWLVRKDANPIEEAKLRQTQAVARKREAEASRLEGESIAVAEAEAVIRDGYAKAQSRLLLIPPRFADVREALEAEILSAINDLAGLKVPQ